MNKKSFYKPVIKGSCQSSDASEQSGARSQKLTMVECLMDMGPSYTGCQWTCGLLMIDSQCVSLRYTQPAVCFVYKLSVV